jgi:hypothetical protein
LAAVCRSKPSGFRDGVGRLALCGPLGDLTAQLDAEPRPTDLHAFTERCKIHDLIMQGVELTLKKRGYPPIAEMKAKWRGQNR